MSLIKKISIVILILCSHSPLLAANGGSFVDGVWQHNHDVADESFQTSGYLTGYNYRVDYNSTIDGNYGQIVGDAKNPLSPGRAGVRKWIGNATNVSTATPAFNFGASYPELWVRYYIRYQEGFSWDGGAPHYDKLLRMFMNYHGGTNSNVYIELQGASRIHLSTEGAVSAYRYPDPDDTASETNGWSNLFTDNGTTSHGRFVCLEMYVKAESSVGADDGIIRIWAEGNLIVEKTNMQFVDPGSADATAQVAGWMNLFISNQNGANNTPSGYVDFDDIVIYNKTPPNTDSGGNAFIGPLQTLVNGSCGSSDGGTFSSTPTTNLCSAGNAGTVTLNGSTYSWDCVGISGGTTDSCSATYSGLSDPVTGLTKGVQLFSEPFEDDSWATRSWYDGTTSTGSTTGGYSGNALKWEWANSATQPTGFTTIRNNLSQATDEFLVEYYVKYDTGWQGSGQTYHPHLMHILSSDDTAYQGFAASNSNLYFESIANTASPYTNYPVFAHQDLVRAVSAENDLTGVTETRSANNCDTPYALTGATSGTCYDSGGWYSANTWNPKTVAIPDNAWTKITAHIKMNTFSNGVGNFDGIIKLWVNDSLAIESNNVLYAAGAYEGSTWDKIALAPWIGDGSPIPQSMWLDELNVWAIDPGDGGGQTSFTVGGTASFF